MAHHCLLYYITDRTQFPGDEAARRRRLLEKIAEAARAGVDFLQLREKDLPTRELELLAREAVRIVQENSKPATGHWPLATRLLINSRADVALAAGADGVHLRSDDISAREARQLWRCGAGVPSTSLRAGLACQKPPAVPLIAVSCHSPAHVARAASESADFAVFAPVFEKRDHPDALPAGLQALRQACQHGIPVLALGGITLENARACLEAGAAGLAAIRLFQKNEICEVAEKLRAIG